jgi:hypothetical protein
MEIKEIVKTSDLRHLKLDWQGVGGRGDREGRLLEEV